MSSSVNLSALRMKYKEKKETFLEENIKVKEPITQFRAWMEEAVKTEEILEPNAASLATVNRIEFQRRKEKLIESLQIVYTALMIWQHFRFHAADIKDIGLNCLHYMNSDMEYNFAEGCPSNRFVLLKEVTNDGFIFFTNYGSRKAKDISHNPNVAMTLYWCPLRRSVRIEGKAEKISHEDSLKYFHERPRASQIGALASEQSTRIASRQHLDEIEKKIKQELGDNKEVPMPNWGGYLIRPNYIEFWQGQTDRLHDRIVFRKGSSTEKDIDNVLIHAGENGWVYERLAP